MSKKPTRKTNRKRIATRRRHLRKWRNSPHGRLEADGAQKQQHIERRALWVVREWQLPTFPPIGRAPSKALSDYLKAHNISADWLFCGDLEGLQRMMQWRRMGRSAETGAPPSSLKEKLDLLSESERKTIIKIVDQFIEAS